MKILGIILLTLFWFFPARPAFAQSASLTATVRVNPLEIEVTAPSTVSVGQWFDIKGEFTNLGSERIHRTTATLNTPPEVIVRGNNKKGLGNLSTGETSTVSWRVKISQSGNFVILVEVTGNLAGEQISASDSTVITATNSLGFLIKRLIFGV